MTRRQFLGFFVLGGFISTFSRKVKAVVKPKLKEAMFWRKKDDA